jgi:3-dehydroquinate synthase
MYPITIEPIENKTFLELINQYDPEQLIAIVDDNTAPFLETIHQITDLNIDAIQLPAGEQFKNINTLAGIWKDLTDNNFRRDGLVINLGGGVISDIGGFAAATYKRGVDFINIPTTLLGMVDAAIGGKTGIDFFDFKNQIGVIKQPKGVFCDVSFLKTLPQEELLSGFAEVIKHGLINDQKYYEYCTSTPFEKLDWNKVVKGSVSIKSNIVKADPEEKGIRKFLNFGHTIGHAIESYHLEKGTPILHGFAVAKGMVVEAYLSVQAGLLSESEFKQIENTLTQLFPKVSIAENEIPGLIQKMKNDKKNQSDTINFTFLQSIGKAMYNQTASEDLIAKALSIC